MNVQDHKICDRYCVFRAAGAPFAVSALSVCEIAERPSLVAVPDAPPALAGLCHFRNEFVPVLNLRHFVGMTGVQQPSGTYMLVLSGREGRWAFVIERGLALEPLEIAYDVNGDGTQALIGTASYREEVVQVLDADVLYDQAVALLEQNWQPAGNHRLTAAARPAIETSKEQENRDQKSEVRVQKMQTASPPLATELSDALHRS